MLCHFLQRFRRAIRSVSRLLGCIIPVRSGIVGNGSVQLAWSVPSKFPVVPERSRCHLFSEKLVTLVLLRLRPGCIAANLDANGASDISAFIRGILPLQYSLLI